MATTTTYKYLNKLHGQHVLIFGGTSGMGYAVAEAVLEHGASIVISGSKPENLTTTVARLQEAYPHVKNEDIGTVACDLLQTEVLEEKLRTVFKAASDQGKRKIDHIVFTAGDALDVAGGITGTDAQVVQKLMAVRVLAPTLIAKVIATSAEYVNNDSARTSFTFTGGTAHVRPRKTWAVMSMVSAAMQGLARGLAFDLAPVRVNVVNPGAVETERLSHVPATVVEGIRNLTLTQKIGKPEDIAEAYLYFMKDSSADGTALTADGGKSLSN